MVVVQARAPVREPERALVPEPALALETVVPDLEAPETVVPDLVVTALRDTANLADSWQPIPRYTPEEPYRYTVKDCHHR